MKEALQEIGNGDAGRKDIARLHGRPGYRLRQGGFRAIYQDVQVGILVLDIGPRGDIYR